MAILSILGLYNYDNTIFDEWKIPEGMDKDILISLIISQCAELEIIYPNPDFFKQYSKFWNIKEFPAWEKMYKSTLLEYNPIENYDRMEEFEDTSNYSNTDSSNTTSKKAGFNAGSLVTNGSGEAAGSSSGNSSNKRTGRIHGNVGVTTAPEMLKQYREVEGFSAYDYIVERFKMEFCILVY